MTAIGAVLYREGKIRATNLTFIFWDVVYPLAYLLVFGVLETESSPGAGPLSKASEAGPTEGHVTVISDSD